MENTHSVEEDTPPMSKILADDFFNLKNETVHKSDHETWLLREYSKLMHRECLVKRKEFFLNKNDPNKQNS